MWPDGHPVTAYVQVPPVHSLEYDAFRQLYERPYLAYARLRTGDAGSATQVVVEAFAALSARWAEALRSECLAADAWNILNTAVGVATELHPGSQRRCHLTTVQADAVRLHHRLGLTLQDTAALMGTDDHTVRAALSSAARIVCSASSCPLGPL
ncbi:RNA polymerase sigma factor [Streptomyces rubiginosohelvolus]|uniref:RNA polymerase sigma factor n=1 Tax=Streptomyces rubiginosohelvolus TaxID=67362 RepID=UPI0037FDE86B